jgi:hypothetical protein
MVEKFRMTNTGEHFGKHLSCMNWTGAVNEHRVFGTVFCRFGPEESFGLKIN